MTVFGDLSDKSPYRVVFCQSPVDGISIYQKLVQRT